MINKLKKALVGAAKRAFWSLPRRIRSKILRHLGLVDARYHEEVVARHNELAARLGAARKAGKVR